MSAKRNTTVDVIADVELLAEMPKIAKAVRGHVMTLADKVVAKLLEAPEGTVARINDVTDVDKVRRDLRYAAYRVDRSAVTREAEGSVFVKLVGRRRQAQTEDAAE